MTVIRWTSRPSCLCFFYIWKEKKEKRKSNSSNASLHTMFVTVLGSIFIYQLVRPLFKVPVLSPVYWHYFFLWTVWSWPLHSLFSFLYLHPIPLFVQLLLSSLPLHLSFSIIFSVCTDHSLVPLIFSFLLRWSSCLDIFISRSQKVEWTLVEPVVSAHSSHRVYWSRKCSCKYWKGSDKNIYLSTLFLVSQLVKITDRETLYVINSYWLTVI